jgi:hypothetical protein
MREKRDCPTLIDGEHWESRFHSILTTELYCSYRFRAFVVEMMLLEFSLTYSFPETCRPISCCNKSVQKVRRETYTTRHRLEPVKKMNVSMMCLLWLFSAACWWWLSTMQDDDGMSTFSLDLKLRRAQPTKCASTSRSSDFLSYGRRRVATTNWIVRGGKDMDI